MTGIPMTGIPMTKDRELELQKEAMARTADGLADFAKRHGVVRSLSVDCGIARLWRSVKKPCAGLEYADNLYLFDHANVWRVGRKIVCVTGEPYATPEMLERAARGIRAAGFIVHLNRSPSWWNPPSTTLIEVWAPPTPIGQRIFGTNKIQR